MLGAMTKNLDAIEATIFDKMKVMVLLVSLPKSYQHLITTLESLKFANHTWDDVCMKLVIEELMRSEKGETRKATSFTHN
jgi:predicted amino acid-binding ACT domain protein